MSRKYFTRSAIALLLFLQPQGLWAAPLELTLSEAVDLALNNNASLVIANAKRDQSAWGVDEAQAGKLPTVSLDSRYSYTKSSSDSDQLNNSVQLNWQLYNGGKTTKQIEQAKEKVLIADLDVQNTKHTLVLDVTTAYFNVLKAQNMLAVNQETVNNLQQHVDIVQAKYAAGVVAKSDVLRSEVEVANAGQNLIKAENTYQLSVAELLNIIDQQEAEGVTLTDNFSAGDLGLTLAESLALAKTTRPDIAQAQANIRIAEQAVAIAKTGKGPSVNLSAGKSWQDSVLANDSDWSAGVSASWNLFDGGVVKAKIKQAEATLITSQQQAKQVQDGAVLEVRQSYLNMLEGQKRIETTALTVKKAVEDLYIAQEKYRAGVGTNLDVIDTQLALTQAKTNQVEALYDFNVSKVQVQKAVGLLNGEEE